MSRDSRNYGGDYDERDLDGRGGPPRGRRPNSGGGGGRGPSDPSMRRPNGNSNGNGMSRPPYGSRAGDSYEMETSRAPRRQRRGFGEMVGEMSRQLSAMVRGTGRAMQREAA